MVAGGGRNSHNNSSKMDNLGPSLVRMGKSISLSVEMLATIGETIGDENPDIRGEMLQACRESRSIGSGLDKLCEEISRRLLTAAANGMNGNHHGMVMDGRRSPASRRNFCRRRNFFNGIHSDVQSLVQALRRLLAAVTRILLLSDNVVVKQILYSNKEGAAGGGGRPVVVGGPGGPDLAASVTVNHMHQFAEFVKAFCDLGTDTVGFVQLLGE